MKYLEAEKVEFQVLGFVAVHWDRLLQAWLALTIG